MCKLSKLFRGWFRKKDQVSPDEEEKLFGASASMSPEERCASWCVCLDKMFQPSQVESPFLFIKYKRCSVLQELHDPHVFLGMLQRGYLHQTSAFKELQRRHLTMKISLHVNGSKLVLSLCLLFFERETVKLASKWLKENFPSREIDIGWSDMKDVILGGLKIGFSTLIGGTIAGVVAAALDPVRPGRGAGDEKVEVLLYKAAQALREFEKNVQSIVDKIHGFDIGTDVFDAYQTATANQLTSFQDFVRANYPDYLKLEDDVLPWLSLPPPTTSSESLLPATQMVGQLVRRSTHLAITQLE